MAPPLFRPNSDLLNGKYRIEAYIGAGSFGQVYKARHVRLDTLRALKVLHPEMTGVGSTALNDYKKRFDLEAKLGAKIDHPNVVKVHNFEADAAGALLLEMEYVPGGTLADLLKQGPAPIERVLAVLRDGLAGLTAMHEHGLGTFVHRDLKPSNILLDATGRAKIADLGSAQTPWDNPSLLGTLAPPHPGTAGYRSPEHEVGNSLLTPSADVYGLGCVAFELLTGKRWFDAQRNADGPRDLRGDVPDWLDAIVRRMLNETPGKKKADRDDATKRYVDCRDVAQAVQQATDAEQAQVAAQAAALARDRAQKAAAAAAEAEAEAARARAQQAAAEAERQRQATAWAEQVGRERQQAAAETERRQREAAQRAEYARQTEAALSAARWGEAMRHARAWLALQPDSAPAHAALKRAEAEQDKANMARTRRALLLGGVGLGGGFVLYAGGQVVTRLFSATPTPTALSPTSSIINRLSDNLVEITLAPGISMQFVRVPAGEFIMGSDKAKDPLAQGNELPQHRVTLPEYWMGKTEVTVAQFAAFVQATNHKTQAEKDGKSYVYTGNTWIEITGADWAHPTGPSSGVTQKQTHPVSHVSWDDSMAYLKWASEISKLEMTLPTEAEWEKAARGTDGRIYPWGNEAPDSTRCNFNLNEKDTTPVGKYGARGVSPYGCDDMAGNVWEWVRSEYKAYPYNINDGRENISNKTQRVLRGGSFNLSAVSVRCALRGYNVPGSHFHNYGFRGSFARLPSL